MTAGHKTQKGTMILNKIYQGNCQEVLKAFKGGSIDCCVTSPPYFGLRDYGTKEQIGLEETPEMYVSKLVQVFTEVKRVLKDEGTLWLNLGDSYCSTAPGSMGDGLRGDGIFAGIKMQTQNARKRKRPKTPNGMKPKDLIGIPWMVAFALRSAGWYLRQDIIWNKPNPMPESVRDRCTKAHEYIFLLSKSPKYFYDHGAIKTEAKNPQDDIRRMKEQTWDNKNTPDKLRNGIRPKGDSVKIDGRANKRSVWTVTTKPFKEAHFATFPQDLITDCIKAGCPENGIVLDPFNGAGTTSLVAMNLNRNFIGIELNPEYIEIAENRLTNALL